MDREGGSDCGSCYYSVLGIHEDVSFSDIRTAYRKLALKWHPDRYFRNPGVAGEAKRRFQQIQEAYSVLSDESKRSMCDAGLYDALEEEDEDFCDFMQEMISMMNNVKDEGLVLTICRGCFPIWSAEMAPIQRRGRGYLTLTMRRNGTAAAVDAWLSESHH